MKNLNKACKLLLELADELDITSSSEYVDNVTNGQFGSMIREIVKLARKGAKAIPQPSFKIPSCAVFNTVWYCALTVKGKKLVRNALTHLYSTYGDDNQQDTYLVPREELKHQLDELDGKSKLLLEELFRYMEDRNIDLIIYT
jgi:hypothetical protein